MLLCYNIKTYNTYALYFRKRVRRLAGTAIIAIGLPASGKTTFLKPLAERQNAVYVCPDETRLLLAGDANNQSVNGEVWDIARYTIGHALYNCSDVILDATNAKYEDRISIIEHCRKHANMIIGLWFTTPVAVCLKRNSMRDRQVPVHAIQRMDKWLIQKPPHEKDGFDLLRKRE